MPREGGAERKGNYWTLSSRKLFKYFILCHKIKNGCTELLEFFWLNSQYFRYSKSAFLLNFKFKQFFVFQFNKIDAHYEEMFENGNFRRRRRMKRTYNRTSAAHISRLYDSPYNPNYSSTARMYANPSYRYSYPDPA